MASTTAASSTEHSKEATLNIMCSICYEFYKDSDKVYSTYPCGHLFHRDCLFRWLQEKRTCPQCCRHCQRHQTHPVYLNYGNGAGMSSANDGVGDEANDQTLTTPQWVHLGDWMIDDPEFELPKGAIKGGTDGDGNDAYLARAHFSNYNMVPASFVPAKRGAYLPFACREHFVRDNIELLVYQGEYEWVPDSAGQVPINALASGYAETRETYYTGRGKHNGLTLPGKVHGTHRVLYMPYKGQEVNNSEYEVLVIKSNGTATENVGNQGADDFHDDDAE